MLNFHKPNKELLMYGKSVCAKNHTDMQGRVVRRQSGACWACCCHLPEGKFNYDFGELKQQEYKHKFKYTTDEEKRQARIDAQIRWNARNKEKVDGYRRKYESKPEIVEKRIQQRDENREKINTRQKNYYHANRAEVLLKTKAYYLEHRDEILAQKREEYRKRKEDHDAISKESQSNTISGVGGEQT